MGTYLIFVFAISLFILWCIAPKREGYCSDYKLLRDLRSIYPYDVIRRYFPLLFKGDLCGDKPKQRKKYFPYIR